MAQTNTRSHRFLTASVIYLVVIAGALTSRRHAFARKAKPENSAGEAVEVERRRRRSLSFRSRPIALMAPTTMRGFGSIIRASII